MSREKTEVKLTVNFFRGGRKFVAHSPALDISTCGDSFEEARRNFAEMADIFIDETIEMFVIICHCEISRLYPAG